VGKETILMGKGKRDARKKEAGKNRGRRQGGK